MTMTAKVTTLLILITSALPVLAQDIPITRWIAGAGDWHDPANWDMGLPSDMGIAIIDAGPVHFAAPVDAGRVWIGFAGMGGVSGAASMNLQGGVSVGMSSGTGQGTIEVTNGSLSISGADLAVLPPDGEIFIPTPGILSVGSGGGTGTNTSFTGNGSFQMSDGDISVEGFVEVGAASGTGTNTSLNGNGDFHLLRGNLHVQGGMAVGAAGGTGSATATAVGSMLIEQGDVIVEPNALGFPSSVRIGTFSGTSSVRGHGEGMLTLIDGRLAADQIFVGNTGGIVDAHGSSDGRLTVRNGTVEFAGLFVGMQSNNGGPTEGVVELLASQASGDQITVGDDGRLVFGIAGADAADYGRIEVTTAFLHGDVEARFIDGFQPARGDIFTLIAADAITDEYSLTVTGLDLAAYPYLTVVRSDVMLRLEFIPEPGGVMLASIALAALAAARRRSSCRHSCDLCITSHPTPI